MQKAANAAEAAEEATAERYNVGKDESYWAVEDDSVLRGLPIGMAISIMAGYLIDTIQVLCLWYCCWSSRGCYNIS